VTESDELSSSKARIYFYFGELAAVLSDASFAQPGARTLARSGAVCDAQPIEQYGMVGRSRTCRTSGASRIQ